MNPITRRLASLLAALALLFAIPSFTLAHGDPHPVHIHEGTCAELAPAPLYPLMDITEPGHADATTGAPILVQTSTTTVDAPLTDLAGGNRAINVHESADNIGTYIACGDIGGAIVAGDAGEMLAIGLGEVNDSGFSGVAILQASGDQTVVSIYLAPGLSGTSSDATPAMDHAATPGTSDTVSVEISGLAYTPAEITITTGQSVTWTNQEAAPHTITARDRDVLQSGTLNQGESFTQVFDTPGTYEYFCEFHPDMRGVVVVEEP